MILLTGKSIKEKLKNNSTIVSIYESVFGKINNLQNEVSSRYDVFTFCIKNKSRFCYGDKNKDKVFFVITIEDGRYLGLYSTIFHMLPYIDYAVKKKWLPVIDLQGAYLPSFQDENEMGKENSWEYYYEQPIKGLTLEDVYQSRHVIVGRYKALKFKVRHPDWNAMFPADEKDLKYWNHIIKQYIRINHGLESRVESEQKRLFKTHNRILGVGIRAGLRAGAMRGGELFINHPMQPTCEELIDIVEEKMKIWKCDALFVSSDDREYLDKFILHFGHKCLYVDRKLPHYFKNDMPVMNIEEVLIEFKDNPAIKEKTETYVVEVYLLAQCNCLYACMGGGAEFAYFLNGGEYEHCEVYNEGMYDIPSNNSKKRDNITGFETEGEDKK